MKPESNKRKAKRLMREHGWSWQLEFDHDPATRVSLEMWPNDSEPYERMLTTQYHPTKREAWDEALELLERQFNGAEQQVRAICAERGWTEPDAEQPAPEPDYEAMFREWCKTNRPGAELEPSVFEEQEGEWCIDSQCEAFLWRSGNWHDSFEFTAPSPEAAWKAAYESATRPGLPEYDGDLAPAAPSPLAAPIEQLRQAMCLVRDALAALEAKDDH